MRKTESEPLSEYHNSVELLDAILKKHNLTHAHILRFCQENHVVVEPTSCLQFGCSINYVSGPFPGYSAIEMDAYSALVLGVVNHLTREQNEAHQQGA